MALIKDFASCTLKESHFYADGTSGDDANDGLSVGTPKKTLAAVSALVPYEIRHNSAVHLSGVFAAPDRLGIKSVIGSNLYLVIDGGSALTVIDDNTGSNYTATAASTLEVTDTAASWAVDALAGYWVKVLTGPAAGQIRLVRTNTADTFTTAIGFTTSPTIGATFAFYRPSTEIAGTATNAVDVCATGNGYLHIQRLYLSGASSYINCIDCDNLFLQAIVSDSTFASNASIWLWYNRLVNMAGLGLRDPSTFAFEGTVQRTGISQRALTGRLMAQYANIITLGNSYIRRAQIDHTVFSCYSGTRFHGKPLLMENIYSSFFLYDFSYSSACLIDGSDGVGIQIKNSYFSIPSTSNKDPIIQNCASHGIDLDHSSAKIEKAIAGTGNTGAGVYAHTHSALRIKSGVTPTITGTAGDLSTDGTTEASTWAAVAGGTPVVDLVELCTIKAE